MSIQKNLWPSEILGGEAPNLPIAMLQEQAAALNEMTRNVLVASVNTQRVSLDSKDKSDELIPGILHTLKITAPAIGNYDFILLRLLQDGASPYPLKLYAPLMEKKYEGIMDEYSLEGALRDVFNHPKTISTIQNLMLQSRSYRAEV